MRRPALNAALCALAVLSGPLALAACHPTLRAEADGTATGRRDEAVPVRAPRQVTFLAPGACAGPGPSFEETPCGGDGAVARVLARWNGPRATGPRCPDRTDYVLHLSAVDAGTSEEDSSPEGYACMRNLRPPHPGDPGSGGGPLTLTGDCVHTEAPGVVKETACDGSQPHAPEYEVTDEVVARADCPDGTDLYVHVGGGTPVGCARRLE
ncbi:hypothetical protein I5Q34_01365 [Streptomyces sp. AV19]|uniref:hypothetical protein n=1 Tax=Streptomyces sp. AV19 TaxID=2793068 RepID=UPI0018FE3D29|nr:hypothetical protein [Streptomyces sp. AV19]MBH1932952.1 hypothetical protein [Streptomyces sp. AV19]MDG4531702.1 hypothetical protein [Streptomyces sp. AV19]